MINTITIRPSSLVLAVVIFGWSLFGETLAPLQLMSCVLVLASGVAQAWMGGRLITSLGSVDNSHRQPEKCASQWHDALMISSKLVISDGNGTIVLESGKRILDQVSELIQMPVEPLVSLYRVFSSGDNNAHFEGFCLSAYRLTVVSL